MALTEQEILMNTNYGLDIYAHILREFYPDETVIFLEGRKTRPSKNPFTNDSLTLVFEEISNQFFYKDLVKTDFLGNPFHFAEMHFKKTGNELLDTIVKTLNLRIGRKRNKFPLFLKQDSEQKPQLFSEAIPRFSLFHGPVTNTIPAKELSLKEVYELILNEYEPQTTQLRNISDKKESRAYKAKNFNYVTFSGTFSSRKDEALIKHSGYLALDFDHLGDCDALKTALLNDPFFETELLFRSPSGDGLKWVISIDITQNTHQEWFLAIKNYLETTYHQKVDSAGKDVSRACFLPNDTQIFINPKYLQK